MKHGPEIEDVVRAHGSLSKAEIMSTFSLTEEDYTALRKWFDRRPGIVAGPQRTGGFCLSARARDGGGPAPVDETSFVTVTQPWERETVARLVELFSHKELEHFVGELLYTIRLARKESTGTDRRGSKAELAEAVIIKHGIDLFRDLEIREAVATKCGVKAPKKWHAGKDAAIEYVRDVRFPAELVGLPSDDSPDDFEYLEGRVDLRELQDFQHEVKRKLLPYLSKKRGRAIVSLPTGAGKTRVAVESLREWMSTRYAPETHCDTVLWLAHSGELCEQACLEVRQMWQASLNVCPLLLVRFYGRFTEVDEHRHVLKDMLTRPSVLVSTPQRLANLFAAEADAAKAVRDDLLSRLSLVVVDEAHRAAAPIYRRILDYLAKAGVEAAVIGLTATPFRAEYAEDAEAGTRELTSLFENLIEPDDTLGLNPRSRLQEREILAEPRTDTVRTATILKSPVDLPLGDEATDEQIERIDRALGVRADNPKRRQAVFSHIIEACRDPGNAILYFGPSVRDAECMTFLLRTAGIPSACVSGATREVSRRQIIRDFRSGQLRVLCNCEVLTTGFDVPRVTHVIMARPTVSKVLYEQMVGRGLRGPKFGGTKFCVVVDCEDDYQSGRPTLGYQEFRHLWKPMEVSDSDETNGMGAR